MTGVVLALIHLAAASWAAARITRTHTAWATRLEPVCRYFEESD